jgi:hypothetical protein
VLGGRPERSVVTKRKKDRRREGRQVQRMEKGQERKR